MSDIIPFTETQRNRIKLGLCPYCSNTLDYETYARVNRVLCPNCATVLAITPTQHLTDSVTLSEAEYSHLMAKLHNIREIAQGLLGFKPEEVTYIQKIGEILLEVLDG